MSKRTVFNLDWLDGQLHPDWVSWLREVPKNHHKARCKICSKDFELSNMGQTSVLSHAKSFGHQKRLSDADASKQQAISRFFKSKEDSSVGVNTNKPDSPPKHATGAAPKATSTLNQFVVREDVTRAEIIWAMRAVVIHSSFRSNSDLGETFQAMFHDSAIAKQFSLGKTKCAYVTVYGLSPYFETLLIDQVKTLDHFVICFDEALNKIAQRGQMDMYIRFWDDSHDEVSTRFLTSVFLGHATADDLLLKFKEGLGDLAISKILQVSMDGPSVNWKFLNNLESECALETEKNILNCGSCGLHVVHGAFQTGHTKSGWNVNNILKALYSLFHNTPARRADFTALTKSTVFAEKFCQCRWVENATVAHRAIEILPNVAKYMKEYGRSLPKYLSADTGTVQKALEDPLTLPKLAFFECIANDIEPFLTRFQSSAPLIPFLAEECEILLRALMKRFVSKDTLNKATSTIKLLKMDLKNTENLISYSAVDIGFAARKFLDSNIKITQSMKSTFRMEARDFLIATCCKIIERSPLSYSLVRNLRCLNPECISSQTQDSNEQMMKSVLQVLYEKKRISSSEAEKVKKQFSALCSEAQTSGQVKSKFLEYCEVAKSQRVRLDAFYHTLLSKNENYVELFRLIKTMLILSHGNAAVESGFSVNKDMLIENLEENSLLALRRVYDAVTHAEGPLGVEIDAKLLRYARGSWKRYDEALKLKRQQNKDETGQKLAEKRVADEMKILAAKKAKLEAEHSAKMANVDAELEKLKHLPKKN